MWGLFAFFGGGFLAVFFGTKAGDALDEVDGEGLVEGEVDRAFAAVIGGEFGFKLGEAVGSGVKADVVFPCGEVDDVAVEVEGGHLVADFFGGVGEGLTEGSTNLLQEDLSGWGEGGDVVIDGGEGGFFGVHWESFGVVDAFMLMIERMEGGRKGLVTCFAGRAGEVEGSVGVFDERTVWRNKPVSNFEGR